MEMHSIVDALGGGDAVGIPEHSELQPRVPRGEGHGAGRVPEPARKERPVVYMRQKNSCATVMPRSCFGTTEEGILKRPWLNRSHKRE